MQKVILNIMSVVHASLLPANDQYKLQIVSVLPITDKIKNLHVITCDLCDREAAYDVFLEGIIKKTPILKRCCDKCVRL